MPAGPMLKARWRTETLGSGSDVWKYWAERCAGNLGNEEWQEIEDCIGRSAGVCMTMGTASTMASVIDALGMTLPGASSIPAVVAEHSRLATATGRRICEMVWEDLKPSDILSAEVVRQRHRRRHDNRRFDQRNRALDRHGAASGSAA